jgi:exosortase/archaeosortase family protein
MQKKELFKNIFIVSSIILCLLPLVATFSAALTTLFDKMKWYVLLQEYVAPFEARFISVLISWVGIKSVVVTEHAYSMLLSMPNGGYMPVTLEWNCLGWQSLILFGVTLVGGLKGKYTFWSRTQTVIFGILGTVIINLLRMGFVVSMAYYWSQFAATIMHDYLASFIAIIWIIFFWWFSYSYILEEKGNESIFIKRD